MKQLSLFIRLPAQTMSERLHCAWRNMCSWDRLYELIICCSQEGGVYWEVGGADWKWAGQSFIMCAHLQQVADLLLSQFRHSFGNQRLYFIFVHLQTHIQTNTCLTSSSYILRPSAARTLFSNFFFLPKYHELLINKYNVSGQLHFRTFFFYFIFFYILWYQDSSFTLIFFLFMPQWKRQKNSHNSRGVIKPPCPYYKLHFKCTYLKGVIINHDWNLKSCLQSTGTEQSATPYLVVNGGVQKVFPAETENNMNESKWQKKEP